MANILNIQTSISGENSVSNKLSQAVINQLLEKNPGSKVVTRDLAANPIPHLEIHHFSASRVPDEEKSEEEKEAGKYSEESLKQLEEADIIVIGVPFYNFTFPSTLKSWIDSIAVGGKTFSYADGTPKGLIHGKKLYLNFAIGGVYENGLIENMEHYLKTLFAFIGITDVEVFQSQGLMVPQLKDENLAKTVAQIEELV